MLAIARLLRAVTHVMRGVWIAWRRFPGAAADQRHAMVGQWAATLLRLLGLDVQVVGGPLPGQGPLLIVANHVSWLDIVVLHACCPQARFVSKAGVGRWPLIGRLTRAADTLFIERESKRDALRVVHHMAEALKGGDILAVFPEGTTSDGDAVLPFHANLLQAAVAAGAPLQPLALRYADALGTPSRAAAYTGTTTLVHSLWRVVRARDLRVQLTVLPGVSSTGTDRRGLALRCQDDIQRALQGPSRA
jgi:1-acyl-sn-glycerol-3-phosphate acyltransferase